MGDSLVGQGVSAVDGKTQPAESGMGTPLLSLERDFDALMSWLSTFPRMGGLSDEYSDMEAVLNDETFTT